MDPVDEETFTLIGRIVAAWGSAETWIGGALLHMQNGARPGIPRGKGHRRDVKTKVAAIRALVAKDGSREDQVINSLEAAYKEIDADRQAIVHGCLSGSPQGRLFANASDGHHLWVDELPAVLEWAEYCRYLGAILYQAKGKPIVLAGDGRILFPIPDTPALRTRKPPLF